MAKVWDETIWVYKVTINEDDELMDYLIGIDDSKVTLTEDSLIKAAKTAMEYKYHRYDFWVGFIEKVECVGVLIMKIDNGDKRDG